ncbi:DUF397 domain-containing protein [Streptomyces sp. NPDC018019]|uniref:DUF397 domain-containing protein n=1 Tax=Streptomyces sp. NPDC018019 TaxID=3365030 RepID=UPI0037BD827A
MSSKQHPIWATQAWQKSSYSNGTGGECVEVARPAGELLLVRDSKNLDGPVLGFSWTAWEEFVGAVQRRDLR